MSSRPRLKPWSRRGGVDSPPVAVAGSSRYSSCALADMWAHTAATFNKPTFRRPGGHNQQCRRPRPLLVGTCVVRQAVWLVVFTASLVLPLRGQEQTSVGICDRTPEVRDALLDWIGGVTACEDVTAAQLGAITHYLDLDSRGITSLKPGDFDGLTNLEILYVRSNPLTTLPEGVFRGLTNLRTLYLDSNNLTTLPDGAFRGLTDLWALVLRNNALTTLPAAVFTNLPNLEHLGLGSNPFRTLPEDVFRSLTNLQALDLTNSSLTTLPEGVFRGLTNLRTLYFASNNLTALPEDVFRDLTNLQALGFTNNFLTALPEDVFRDLTNLQALSIGLNPLRTLPEGVFRGLTNLQTLDLTATSLPTLPEDVFRDLTNLETLRLVNNFLTTLPEGVFRSLTNLQTLDLFYNRFLTTLPEGVFRGLTNLQTLDLSYSNLLALPESVFSSLTNLQTLRFRGGNSLTELPENVFSSLTNLRTLYLDSNNLTTLPEGVFRGLTNLQTLNLAYNSLTTLPEGVFRDLANLQTLDLSYNFLSPPPVLLEDLRARGVEVNSDGNMDFEPTERTPISITGDSANRIDLVIVSEAYTASEMGRFAEDVNAIQAGLFSEDPFLEYADYFNIWRIEVPSNESGADRPNNTPPIMRDTAFDSFLGGGGGGLNGRKLTRVIGGMPPSTRDAVVVLINDPALSGFAGGIAVATNGGANNVFVNTVGHELGHSLGGLADEYAGGIPCSSTYTRQEPRAANVTQETDRAAIKWRHWIDPATPIPTTTSSETTFSEGVPGLYEGAQYCEKRNIPANVDFEDEGRQGSLETDQYGAMGAGLSRLCFPDRCLGTLHDSIDVASGTVADLCRDPDVTGNP